MLYGLFASTLYMLVFIPPMVYLIIKSGAFIVENIETFAGLLLILLIFPIMLFVFPQSIALLGLAAANAYLITCAMTLYVAFLIFSYNGAIRAMVFSPDMRTKMIRRMILLFLPIANLFCLIGMLRQVSKALKQNTAAKNGTAVPAPATYLLRPKSPP